MNAKDKKRHYNHARRLALQELAREHPERYQELVEKHLGRSLDEKGRVLTQRIKTGEKRTR